MKKMYKRLQISSSMINKSILCLEQHKDEQMTQVYFLMNFFNCINKTLKCKYLINFKKNLPE